MFQGKEYVYEVYKEKSFSKAAHNLYISQPSLSATIRKIENRIGSPIFDRSTTPIRLTECGEKYVKCMEKIMDIENDFESYLNNLDQLRAGSLTVGGSHLFASYVLPPIISRFMAQYPFIDLKVVEANTELLEQQLFSGSLDLVLDNYTFDEKIYARHFLCKERLLLTVPKKFASNKKAIPYQLSAQDILKEKHLSDQVPAVPLDFFKDDPFLLLRTGNDTRQRSERIFQWYKISPKVVLKLDQQVTAYNLACYGMGITFTSDTLVQNVMPSPNVVYYKLEDAEDITRDVLFYRKQTKYVTRAMEEFLKIACGS